MNRVKEPYSLIFLTEEIQTFIVEAQQSDCSDQSIKSYVDRLKEILLRHMNQKHG